MNFMIINRYEEQKVLTNTAMSMYNYFSFIHTSTNYSLIVKRIL